MSQEKNCTVYSRPSTEYGDTDQRRIHKRSSHRWCFVRRGVLRNFAKFTGKYLRRLQPATLLKRDSSAGVFL